MTIEGHVEGDYTPAACRNLAAALLLQAVKDARRGDECAAAWVLGAEALTWADWLGVPWPPKFDSRRGAGGARGID